MKPAPFHYHRPRSVDEALELLARLDDAKLLAGGQSLMPMMNFRYLTPAHVVDLNRVPELAGIATEDATLVIGAMTRQRDVKASPQVAARCPLLPAALAHVGHLQTRNRGTLGGSLVHLDPAAELPGVLLALDAELEVRSVRGERRVAMAHWPLAWMTPALEPDELLVRVRVTPWPAGHGVGFHEVARRHGDFALAGAAALVHLEGGAVKACAVALFGVAEVPLRLEAAQALLVGHAPDAGRVQAAARTALEVPGLDDVHASAAYRRRIAEVVTRRALEQALSGAGAAAAAA